MPPGDYIKIRRRYENEDTMAGGGQQQNVDLSALSLEQLNQMKTQHEEEVQTLSGNFIKLRDAQVKLGGRGLSTPALLVGTLSIVRLQLAARRVDVTSCAK